MIDTSMMERGMLLRGLRELATNGRAAYPTASEFMKAAASEIEELDNENAELKMLNDSLKGRLDFVLDLLEEVRNADPTMEDMIQWQTAKAAGYLDDEIEEPSLHSLVTRSDV